MKNKILLVALDGLDRELIEEFGLTTIKQKEYAKIDNSSGMHSIKTSELFASLITGKNYEDHGIKGFAKSKPIRDFLMDHVFPNSILNFRGGTRLKRALEILLDSQKEKYDKRDIKEETLFDKIDNSNAMFVPSWNPSVFWKEHTLGIKFRDWDHQNRRIGYWWDELEFERRKRHLFRPVNKWFDFTMIHFHRPDIHHHLYGDTQLSSYDMDKLRDLYEETDNLAAEIIDFFEDDYDYIIFMSDHGLPTEKEHNENAFYSSNVELFGSRTPHITDFYDKILELNKES
jgi:hypothetical protein